MNNWKVYHGICCEDKVRNSRIAKVYIRELLPFVVGELADNDGIESFTYIDDVTGEKVSEEVVTSNHITAEWLGLDTNRVFPPDIVRGEQLLVVKYSDEDLYYWLPMGRDDRLRRLELHRIAVSDDQSVDKDLDDENTYFIELDTLYNKRIRIVTSKADDEDFRYEIVIDAKRNFLSLSDDDNNEIIIESDIPRVKLRNHDGTLLDLNKKDAIILAPQDIIMSADRQVVISTGNITLKAKQAIVSDAPNIGSTSSHFDMDTGTLGVSGSAKIMGAFMTTLCQATSYTTGSPGAPYPTVSINVGAGSGTTVEPSAESGDGAGNRYVSSWEEMNQCMNIIFTEFNIIDGHGGDETITLSGQYQSLPNL